MKIVLSNVTTDRTPTLYLNSYHHGLDG